MTFEDVLHHLETVYYTEHRPDPKKPLVRSAPFWKDNILRYRGFSAITRISETVSLNRPKRGDLLQTNLKFYDDADREITVFEESRLMEHLRERIATRRQSGGFTRVEEMTLLNKNVFQDNAAFQIDYVVNNIDCEMSLFKGFHFECFESFASYNLSEPDLSQTEDLKHIYDGKIKSFLRQKDNRRILHRSPQADLLLFEADSKEPQNQAQANKKAFDFATKANIRPQPAKFGHGLSTSPTVIAKQISLIRHLAGDVFVVLTNKSVLSLYDKERRMFFYVHEIKEQQFHARIVVYSQKLFCVELKRSVDDSEYFKILIFNFSQQSMTVRLVNRQMQLVKYISKDVVFNSEYLYLLALKTNFLGIVVFRFKLRNKEGDLELGISKEHLKTERKQIVFLEEHFPSAMAIKSYQRKLKSARIGCKSNDRKVIACAIQFASLDSLFMQFLLFEPSSRGFRGKSSEAESQARDKSSTLFETEAGSCSNSVERILVKRIQKDISKSNSGAHRIRQVRNKFKDKKSKRRPQPDTLKQAPGKRVYNQDQMWQLDLLNSSNNYIVWLSMIRLIKNHHNSKLVNGTRIYFYKNFLVLLYRLKSVIRIFFYNVKQFLDDPLSSQSKVSAKEFMSFQNGKLRIEFVSLFYRLELNILSSTFLDVHFSEDVELVEEKTQFRSVTKSFEVVGIMRVVFNNRVETFRLSPKVKIFLKNRTLDFAKMQLFAQNHLQKKEGKSP